MLLLSSLGRDSSANLRKQGSACSDGQLWFAVLLAGTHCVVRHFVASSQLAFTLTANGRVMPLHDMLVPVKVTVLTCSEKPICGGMMPVTPVLLLKSAASSA
jgi:hypothetical protein